MKEFLSKKQNQLLVMLFLAIVIIFGMVFILISQLLGVVDSQLYPQSTLKEAPEEFGEEFSDETLPMVISCPTLDYKIHLPENVSSVGEDEIIGTYNNLAFVVCESKKDIDTMIQKDLPGAVYTSVVGYSPKVSVRVEDEGYFFPYKAKYRACEVVTKISVREVTTYAFAYQLMLTEDKSLYIYVTTTSKELLNDAKGLLDKIASSVRPLVEEEKEVSKEEGNELVSEMTREEYYALYPDEEVYVPKNSYTIYLEKDCIDTVRNGIFLIEWSNFDTAPTELSVYAPNGEKLAFNEEYSVKGHYVYNIGEMDSGVYVIKGSTKKQIKDAVMFVMEWDFYYDQYVTFGFEQ